MGLNISNQTGEQPAAKPQASAETVRLVLAGGLARYKRGIHGDLFTDQKSYLVSPEDAEEMLSWEIDEVPVFKRWKAPRKPKDTDDEQPVVRPPRAENYALDAAKQQANRAGGRLEIGSPEEEAELFGKLDEEAGGDDHEDGGQGDDNGVSV